MVGGTEDERRLVRGLLLLHRRPVDLEASTLDALPAIVPEGEPRVMVYVAPPEDARWPERLAGVLAARPGLPTLVVAPSAPAAPGRSGAWTVLSRPFTSREFLEAIDGLGSPSPEHRAAPSPRDGGPGRSG